MNRYRFASVVLHTQIFLRRVGTLRIAIVLLLCAGNALWFGVLPRLQRDSEESNQQLKSVRLALRRAPVIAAAPKLAPAAQRLIAFQAALGQRQQADVYLKTLFQLAAEAGLKLERADYKLTRDAASQIDAYQIQLPLKGNYRAIRQFSEQVLRALPFAALDEIHFKRQTVGDATLEARLRFSLYLVDLNVPSAPVRSPL